MSHTDFLKYLNLLVLTMGCGSGSQSSRDVNAVVRNSGKVSKELAKKQNIDMAPQLTADGSKVVFISGKSGKLRAYQFNVGVVGTEEAPNPSTVLGVGDDFGDEKEVDVSKTGAFAVVGFLKDGKYDLAIQFLSGNKTFIRITDDVAVESQVAVSYDERIIAYSIGNPGSRKTSLYVVNVDTTAQTISTPAKMQDVEPFALGPVWLKSTNTLLVSRFNITSGDVEGQTVSFSDPTTTSHSVASLSIKSENSETGIVPRIDREGSIDASSDSFFFTEIVQPSVDNKVGHSGDDETNTSTFKRERRIVSFPATSGNPTRAIDPSGFSLLTFTASTSGLMISSVRQFFACKDVAKPFFATGMQLIDTSTTPPSIKRISPLFYSETTKEWSAAETVCPYFLPTLTPAVSVDSFMRETVINADATTQKFTVVYTSNFSGQLDGSVNVLGDTELYVLAYDAAKYGLVPLWRNTGN